MDKELRILILEDNPADAALEEHELTEAGLIFTSKVVDTRDAFLKELDEFSPDIILSDYDLPSFDGLAALRIAKEKCPDIPFILVTGKLGEEFAIEKLKEGTTDYVLKGNLKRLVPSVNRALEEAKQIKERTHMEDELRKSEAKYYSLFANMDEAVALHDMIYDDNGHAVDYVILDVNPAYERNVGITKDEIVGRKVSELFKFAPYIVHYAKVADSGKPTFFEAYFRPLEKYFSISAFSTDKGKFATVFRDITERKQAEEALRISEEQYRLVVENAHDTILILQDGMIKFSNHQAMVLSGYSKEEITSVPFSSFIHAEDRDMVMEIHHKRLKGEDIPATHSFRFINKSGETVWVQVTGILITWEGSPAALVFLKDITIQKKLEEQLLQSQKMEAIGTLAGGIAHNVNNLLMTILGYTSLMLMKTEKTHPFYEKLKIIEKEVESGAELTRQLLGFARGGKYQVKPINVNDLIIKTSDIFGKTKKEITIHKKLQEDLHTIEADSGQIEQVLFEPVCERMAGDAFRREIIS